MVSEPNFLIAMGLAGLGLFSVVVLMMRPLPTDVEVSPALEDKSPTPYPALEAAAITPQYDIDLVFESVVGSSVAAKLEAEKRRQEAFRRGREKMEPLRRAVQHMLETYQPVGLNGKPFAIGDNLNNWDWGQMNIYAGFHRPLRLGYDIGEGYHVYQSGPSFLYDPSDEYCHISHHTTWQEAYRQFLELLSPMVESYKGAGLGSVNHVEAFV